MTRRGVLEHFAYVVSEMFAVESLHFPQVLCDFRPLNSALLGVGVCQRHAVTNRQHGCSGEHFLDCLVWWFRTRAVSPWLLTATQPA